jgi:hypothetical protein
MKGSKFMTKPLRFYLTSLLNPKEFPLQDDSDPCAILLGGGPQEFGAMIFLL